MQAAAVLRSGPVGPPGLTGVADLGRAAVASTADATAASALSTASVDAVLASLPISAGGGSAAREPGLQTRVGALQQGADYLDRLGQSVQDFKQRLSLAIARGDGDTAALQASVDRIEALWQARRTDAGGQLDAQLQPPSGAPAQQRFQVRGLDAASLQGGGPETLNLRVPGLPTQARVQIQGDSAAQGAKALRDALAPAGVQLGAQGGTLWFSVDESRWPALRDGLAVQGNGRRFPSGQSVRPALDPAPAAVDTRQWRVGSVDERRATLRSLTQVQARIAKARQGCDAALGQSSVPVSDADLGTDAAAALGRTLGSAMQDADFKQLAALSPALRGLHRERVRQMLSGG
jgi:hypothetical protein